MNSIDKPALFYVEALFDHVATTPEDLNFKTGDMIAVTDTPNDGWWHGILVDETKREHGRHSFPANFVMLVAPRTNLALATVTTRGSGDRSRSHDDVTLARRTRNGAPVLVPVLFYVRALYDYEATIPEELNLHTGDTIAVTRAGGDGWWSGHPVDESKRETGIHVFPVNFVAPVSEDDRTGFNAGLAIAKLVQPSEDLW